MEQVWFVNVYAPESVLRCMRVTSADQLGSVPVQNQCAARHYARVAVAELLNVPLTLLRTEVVHES